jgi:uncharacterized protein YqeY
MDDLSLKAGIMEDMKAAMRNGDKPRLGAIRLILAAIKQQEVDTRRELDDAQIMTVLNKMVKQRKDSLSHFSQAGRDDLVAKEQFELDVIKAYMPAELSAEEIESLISSTIAETGASSMKDMGKVMGRLKPQLAGRADMAAVSARVKACLVKS